jgi:hypothetical protein
MQYCAVDALSGVRLDSADVVGQLLLLREVVLRYHHARIQLRIHHAPRTTKKKKSYVHCSA